MSVYRTRTGTNLNTIKNSISDILPNKSQESLERTKFMQSQHASLVKAINIVECPVKEKHIRNIILGTCYEKSAVPFWYGSIKLQLHGNPILCWKFCYVLHKILRDGYSSCAEDSFQFVATLDDLAKSWIHLQQNYGSMLHQYLNYLAFKIKFHKKNQFIPCNLMIEDKDLIEVAGNNIDNYFQLCCEFFDYIDEIMTLQNIVFSTMDRSRSNSMTESGQCKLAPLVLCIQESNQLYDFCVKFLFKLHDNLPGEILEGHRDRFLNVFKQLTKFYECSKNLQYFKSLISIPELPAIPPNFRQKSDFSSYAKPVMRVVTPEPTPSMNESTLEDSDSILVDFSDPKQAQLASSASSLSINNDLQQVQLQQYMYTQSLLQELDRLRSELENVRSESSWEINELKEMNKRLSDDLHQAQTQIEQQKIINTSLEEKIRISNENEKAKADLANLEKKSVSSEEKFNKMKDLYTKLKDQHVTLLRQEADVRKQKFSLAEECEHLNRTKKELQSRMNEAVGEKLKFEESLQEISNELQCLKSENEKSQMENLNMNQTYQEQIKHLKDKLAGCEFDLSESNEKLMDLNEKKKEIAELKNKCDQLIGDKELAENSYRLNQAKLCQDIYFNSVEMCALIIKDSLNLFDDPVLMNCKSGSEYLLYKLQPFADSFSELVANYTKLIVADNVESELHSSEYSKLLKLLNGFTLLTSDCVIFGKITSLTAADIDQGKELARFCQMFGKQSLDFLLSMLKKGEPSQVQIKELNDLMAKINSELTDLLPKVHDINNAEIGDLIDQEMNKTSEAIESAVLSLELLINKSRENETGVKLEVNDKILDACTSLMKAIKILIIKAQDLQKEIVAQGRGASSIKEFYSKNQKWTEGLVSGAKLIGVGANLLIDKADKLVNGDGSLEEIIVCSNEIAASTAQLVVSSNVKANRESENRIKLINAKNDVSAATANLVASAKSCSKIIDDKSSMDFSNISLHQTKMLEMEAQVAVIHLEKQLENEKKKLYALRKAHYKSDTENSAN